MKRVEPTEPAFPKPYSEAMGYGGINVRAYIATHALAGLLSAPGNTALGAYPQDRGLSLTELVAERCVQFADALITELNKETPHAK